MRISTLALCASILANPLYAQSLAQPVDPSLSERRQIENTWILTFSEDVDFEEAPGRARGLAARFGGEVVHEYSAVFRGAALRMKLEQWESVLRTNLTDTDPVKLWEYYLQLTEIEQAFKELKSDLAIRPVYHQLPERIEAHIFISFFD